MSFIETVPAEQATGEVEAMYARLQGASDRLPNYARVFSHRPGLMGAWSNVQASIRDQLDDKIYLLVNLAAARASGSSYCALAFASRLLSRYYREQELIEILTGSPESPFSEAEWAVWTLATRVAVDASTISAATIEPLRRAGFSDTAVFDIVAAAAARCFFSRIPDALGVQPDPGYRELSPALRRQLVVGRDIEVTPCRQPADRQGDDNTADPNGE